MGAGVIPTISSSPQPQDWAEPVNTRMSPLRDVESGGPVLGGLSESNSYVWEALYTSGSIIVQREGVAPVTLLSAAGITELSLAFDHTMNPHVAYVENGLAKWRYWNSLAGAYATMTLTGARTPRCCSDDKLPAFSGDRDVVLCYLRGSIMYARLQRDRYTIEYELEYDDTANPELTETTSLVTIAMNKGRRLQWRFVP